MRARGLIRRGFNRREAIAEPTGQYSRLCNLIHKYPESVLF